MVALQIFFELLSCLRLSTKVRNNTQQMFSFRSLHHVNYKYSCTVRVSYQQEPLSGTGRIYCLCSILVKSNDRMGPSYQNDDSGNTVNVGPIWNVCCTNSTLNIVFALLLKT